jgi:hypothetical protein
MKLETALNKAFKFSKSFQMNQVKKLQKGLKTEFSKGIDVHGQKFEQLSKGYKKRKIQGIASRGQQNISGKPDMFLTGDFLNSSYFNKVKYSGKNTVEMTTGKTYAGTKALQHSGKIKMPSGLPIRAIVGKKAKDDVVHPKLKKKLIQEYSNKILELLNKIPKKEFL